MTRCTDCGFNWQMPRRDVLSYAAARVPRYRKLISPELRAPVHIEGLRARPGEEIWSPLEYLAHMRDVTEFFTDRVKRVLAEDRPALHVQFRFAELAELRSYRTEDPAVVLSQFEHRAAELQALLAGLDQQRWDRAGIGSGGDERTVLMLARRFAHETHHHLLDIEAQLKPET